MNSELLTPKSFHPRPVKLFLEYLSPEQMFQTMLQSTKKEPIVENNIKGLQTLTDKMEKGIRRRVATQSQLASEVYGRNFKAYTQRIRKPA